MFFINRLLCLIALLFLMGCQYMGEHKNLIRNRANDYMRTSLIEPLRVPPGLSHPDQNEIYPLPKALPEGKIESVSVKPPGFGTL